MITRAHAEVGDGAVTTSLGHASDGTEIGALLSVMRVAHSMAFKPLLQVTTIVAVGAEITARQVAVRIVSTVAAHDFPEETNTNGSFHVYVIAARFGIKLRNILWRHGEIFHEGYEVILRGCWCRCSFPNFGLQQKQNE